MKEGIKFTLSTASHIEQIAPYDMEFKQAYLRHLEERAPAYILFLFKAITAIDARPKGDGYDIHFMSVDPKVFLKYAEENYAVD